jgi:hypothetical protein
MKPVLIALALTLAPVGVGPAHAYHDGRYRDDRDCESGNCGNSSDDEYGQCKYACPNFDKSPVHDAFNFSPFICMPGATCYQKDPKQEEPK